VSLDGGVTVRLFSRVSHGGLRVARGPSSFEGPRFPGAELFLLPRTDLLIFVFLVLGPPFAPSLSIFFFQRLGALSRYSGPHRGSDLRPLEAFFFR